MFTPREARIYLNHMVPLWAGVAEDLSLLNSPLSSTATKTLAKGADSSPHRVTTKPHLMTERAELLQTGCWNSQAKSHSRNTLLSTSVMEHS